MVLLLHFFNRLNVFGLWFMLMCLVLWHDGWWWSSVGNWQGGKHTHHLKVELLCKSLWWISFIQQFFLPCDETLAIERTTFQYSKCKWQHCLFCSTSAITLWKGCTPVLMLVFMKGSLCVIMNYGIIGFVVFVDINWKMREFFFLNQFNV